jgi:hypothetical protein
MGQEFARLADNCRVAIERRVSFASRFSSGVVLGCDIGDRSPLRFAVYAIQRLIA